MALDATPGQATWFDVALTAADDTEESVLGSDLHQDAIYALRDTLRRHSAQHGLNWYVSSQVQVIVPLPRREDWHPSPDIFVVPGLGATPRTSYDTRRDGPMPPFVVEVVSPSTWRADVGSKADAYQLAGVREYIVFDPTGELLGTSVRAWHGEPGAWTEWTPTGGNWWQSTVLSVALRPEGLLLRVYDSEGTRLDTSDELAARLRVLEAEIARLRGGGSTP
jgi:Uma2 family endonuclease